METVMGFGKIPVWVYTAKNGYAWQGMDEEGEDRPTVALLDKALAAAGNTAGAWGAMVRRPVASRRWKEWPASRLCWVLFRFHPDAGRDQRGRSCNYTAAACIPAGLPPLDFAIIFQAPEMSEVQTEGFGDLGIDLDGEEYLLHEREGEPDGDPAGPSWAESWSAPVLLDGNALQTLSRWCQRAEADRGDLKAVVLEGGRAAHATFAVYPQVAAALLAEAEYGRVKGRGGDAERTALSVWEKALEPVSALNRVLGGLQGLEDLLSACKRSQAEARAALSLAERTAREMEEAHRLADDIAKALRQFRMSADAASGKTRNRDALDGLARRIMEARRLPGGSDDVWNDLASRLETLRGRVEEIEGCLDTVREYADAANQDDMRWSGLEPRARHAADRIRALSKVHTRLVPEDVLQETTRAFEQERKAPTASQESKKWVQGKPSPTEPVRFGGGKQANGAVAGAQGEAIPRRKTSARWRRILSLVTVLAIMAGMAGWAFSVVKDLKMRKSQRKAFQSALGAASEAKSLHDALVQELKDISIGKSTRKETYESFRKKAESLSADLDFDADGNPAGSGAERRVGDMADEDVRRLTENCKQAEEAWKQAGLALARGAHEERYNAATVPVARLTALRKKPGRYEDFRDAAPEAWNRFELAKREIEKLSPSPVTFDDDGWSFQDGTGNKNLYLDKEARGEFFEHCGRLEKSFGAAADALAEAQKGIMAALRKKMDAEKARASKAYNELKQLLAAETASRGNRQDFARGKRERLATARQDANQPPNRKPAERTRGPVPVLPEEWNRWGDFYSSLAEDYEKAKAALEEAIQEMDSPKETDPSRGEEPTSEEYLPSPEDSETGTAPLGGERTAGDNDSNEGVEEAE